MEERSTLLNAINKLQLQFNSMEFFGARPQTPIETCLEEISKSDLIILIIGNKYGSLIPNWPEEISFSQAEYKHAMKLGKPILAYFKEDDISISKDFLEQDPQKSALLTQWKNEIKKTLTVAYFKTPDDLALQFSTDIFKLNIPKKNNGIWCSTSLQLSINSNLDFILEQIRKLPGVERTIFTFGEYDINVQIFGNTVQSVSKTNHQIRLIKGVQNTFSTLGIAANFSQSMIESLSEQLSPNHAWNAPPTGSSVPVTKA